MALLLALALCHMLVVYISHITLTSHIIPNYLNGLPGSANKHIFECFADSSPFPQTEQDGQVARMHAVDPKCWAMTTVYMHKLYISTTRHIWHHAASRY